MTFVGNTQLVAGTGETIPEVLSMLKKEGIETEGNPDVYVREYRQFGIEEAREIRERASLRSARRARRVFVVVTPHLTHEAQNALLKTLEEPLGNALFFLVVPSPETLLPTLRSRTQMLQLERKEKSDLVDVKEFLSAHATKRLDLLKPLLEKGDDERRDLGAIITFLASLERTISKTKDVSGLHLIYRARKYIADRGALVKPLLEQVALLVPRV